MTYLLQLHHPWFVRTYGNRQTAITNRFPVHEPSTYIFHVHEMSCLSGLQLWVKRTVHSFCKQSESIGQPVHLTKTFRFTSGQFHLNSYESFGSVCSCPCLWNEMHLIGLLISIKTVKNLALEKESSIKDLIPKLSQMLWISIPNAKQILFVLCLSYRRLIIWHAAPRREERGSTSPFKSNSFFHRRLDVIWDSK